MKFTPNPNPPHTTITPEMTQWLANGRRGISSETIFTHLSGIDALGTSCPSFPLDPSDFKLCMNLLAQCPTLRPHLKRMAELGPVWAALVGAWDSFEAMLYHGESARVANLMCHIIKTNNH